MRTEEVHSTSKLTICLSTSACFAAVGALSWSGFAGADPNGGVVCSGCTAGFGVGPVSDCCVAACGCCSVGVVGFGASGVLLEVCGELEMYQTKSKGKNKKRKPTSFPCRPSSSWRGFPCSIGTARRRRGRAARPVEQRTSAAPRWRWSPSSVAVALRRRQRALQRASSVEMNSGGRCRRRCSEGASSWRLMKAEE